MDTGCFVKLHYPEPDSAQVIAKIQGKSICYAPLHELECGGGLVLYRANRFGMREGVLACGRNWNLHAIVFGHFPGRFQKRIVRAEIYQRSLQRVRVSARADLRALAKQADLRPATAQSKIINLEQL